MSSSSPWRSSGASGRKRAASLEPFGGIAAQQVEGECHRRPAPRHIVLQVAVEALVAQVELGPECDDEDVEVEGFETERLAQQRQRGTASRRGVRRRVAIQQRAAGRGRQRAIDLSSVIRSPR